MVVCSVLYDLGFSVQLVATPPLLATYRELIKGEFHRGRYESVLKVAHICIPIVTPATRGRPHAV